MAREERRRNRRAEVRYAKNLDKEEIVEMG